MQLRILHSMMLGLAVTAGGVTGTFAHTGENASASGAAHKHHAQAVLRLAERP